MTRKKRKFVKSNKVIVTNVTLLPTRRLNGSLTKKKKTRLSLHEEWKEKLEKRPRSELLKCLEIALDEVTKRNIPYWRWPEKVRDVIPRHKKLPKLTRSRLIDTIAEMVVFLQPDFTFNTRKYFEGLFKGPQKGRAFGPSHRTH